MSIHRFLSTRNLLTEILNDPQEFLGPNYETVLNFWKYVEALSSEQYDVIEGRFISLSRQECEKAMNYTYDCCDETHRYDVWQGVCYWARYEQEKFTSEKVRKVIAEATLELMVMHILFKGSRQLLFVPLFDSL